MARKMMTKEVTKTTVKSAVIEMVDGSPVTKTLEDTVLMGNVSVEKAQKELNKKFGQPVTVFEVTADTETYEMPVEEFIKYASVKAPEVPEQTEAN